MFEKWGSFSPFRGVFSKISDNSFVMQLHLPMRCCYYEIWIPSSSLSSPLDNSQLKRSDFVNLKYLRTLKGISQKDVSQAIGCSEVVYNRYENGKREPPIDVLIELADFFDVTTDLLLGHNIEASELLSEYEVSLIRASRRADQRAREDALSILISHAQNGKNSI